MPIRPMEARTLLLRASWTIRRSFQRPLVLCLLLVCVAVVLWRAWHSIEDAVESWIARPSGTNTEDQCFDCDGDCKDPRYREKFHFHPELFHEEPRCQKTLHFPFRVGCPADCTPYSGFPEGRRLTMQWYFGEPIKYEPKLSLEQQVSYYNRGRNFQCPKEFVGTFQKANRDAVARGNRTIPAPDLRFHLQKSMHLSLVYLCCLTKEQSEKAQGILLDMIDHWTASVTVRFDQVQCWHETPSSVTNIVKVDDESQCKLFQLLRIITGRLKAEGIPVWIPREDQMPFHVTLVGMRLGKNVESCLPHYNISSTIPAIYSIMQQISNDYQWEWNPRNKGMTIDRKPRMSLKADVHTGPVKDCRHEMGRRT